MGLTASIGQWVQFTTAAMNCVAAALLISAGVSKLVKPDPFREALEEVVRGAGRLVSRPSVRLIAVLEIVGALALTSASLRVLAAFAVGCLGFCFVALGLAGSIRGSRLPCGCFGAANGSRPLGLVNVASGAFFMLLLPANLLQNTAVETIPSLYVIAIAIVSWTFWVHRGLVGDVLIRRADRVEVTEL